MAALVAAWARAAGGGGRRTRGCRAPLVPAYGTRPSTTGWACSCRAGSRAALPLSVGRPKHLQVQQVRVPSRPQQPWHSPAAKAMGAAAAGIERAGPLHPGRRACSARRLRRHPGSAGEPCLLLPALLAIQSLVPQSPCPRHEAPTTPTSDDDLGSRRSSWPASAPLLRGCPPRRVGQAQCCAHPHLHLDAAGTAQGPAGRPGSPR